jgi:uncharacterized protein (TIGR04255 family)
MSDEKREPIAAFLPKVEPVTYQRNLIKQVVCELRFPTVYGLVRGKPPLSLASALRKSFPEHGTLDGLNVGPGGVAQDFAFAFKDKKKRTSVTFRPAALNIETTAYHSFEELLDTVLLVANAAKETIDSEFFTRVGLRYINGLPFQQVEIGEWVNTELVAPLAHKSLGIPVEFNGRAVVAVDGGGFILQHGLGKDDDSKTEQYVLDFDVWREDVPWPDLQTELQELHEAESRLFHWSIGRAALAYMGPAKPKPQRPKAEQKARNA